ncbi:GntR family transcriptional regulator [Brevibacterium metallidurans]|uniref:GntR family transcriptional regulator n=1 Tax=Brevibacterium metallidurans TaxID=1482676 RepID=A0ABP3C7F4_9MICO
MSQPHTSELPVLRRVVRSSTIDLVAEEIRNAIYRGSLLPGQAINEVRTAELLGVSRPSLREALQRLVSEGSVSHAPGRGAWVKRMGTEDIDDVYAVREAIEVQAVRMIIRGQRATALIDEALEALESVVDGSVARVIGDADLDFHHAIVACSGSPRLTTLMKASMVHTRLLSLSAPGGYEVRCDLIDVHRSLAEAIAAGDEEQAVGIVARISAEAVARLRNPASEPEAVVVRGEDGESGVDDQWASLRE